MDSLRQDLRYALRRLSRSVGFSAVVVLTLALGIGGTTAVFSFVNAVLLRPLPIRDPGEVVWLSSRTADGQPSMSFSHPEFVALRDGSRALERVAAFGLETFRVEVDGTAATLVGAAVSDGYFSALGVSPARGRLWDPGAAEPAVVVSDALWRGRFRSDPAIVGRVVRIGDAAVTVVGVAPPGFGGTISLVGLDLWMPFATLEQVSPGEDRMQAGSAWLQVIGRRRDGVSSPAVRAEATAIARREGFGAAYGRAAESVGVEPLSGLNGEGRAGAVRVSVLLLLVAGLVLGIACVNIAGMLIARDAQRRTEMAVRAALGAGSVRLARQVLTETLVLWAMGGAAGVAVALALGRVFPAVAPVPASFPARIGLEMGLDWRVLAFAAAATLVSGFAFGVAPALRAARADLTRCMKEQGGDAPGRARFRSLLTVGQVAASVLLLVCAGLLLRSLQEVTRSDPGFDPDGVSTIPVELRLQGEPAERARRRLEAFSAEAHRRLGTLPEVESLALASSLPGLGAGSTTRVQVGGRVGPIDVPLEVEVAYHAVSPEFFQTLRLPLLAGRGPSRTDRFGGAPVAVVSAEMARQFWPGADPLGRSLRQGDLALEVVGVVGDVTPAPGGATRRPTLYVPLAQQPSERLQVLVRSHRPVTHAMLASLREADPAAWAEEPQSLREAIVSAVPHRILVPVLAAFGLLALALSMVGIYGVVSFFTTQRTRELGIRAALGAEPREIVGMVLRRGVALVLGGAAAGLPLALLAARALRRALGGTAGQELATLAWVLGILFCAAVLACLWPALRAVRSDPVQALRAE